MTIKYRVRRQALVAAMLATLVATPQTLWAQSAIDDSPNAAEMVGDLLVARPIGLVMTAGGLAAFVVSLPFTLLAGHASEAAETLMVGPAKETFMRCLGCREAGYTYKDIERARGESAKVD
ncbi:hypothetical protein H2508_10690 [Parahaliea sp. F7430]|uniref:Multidrug transporter n=1 Tax=Sediminihaliea albiluteola TaxID=2758564 RepID=A0A7W2TX74_9GAMM|nr:hypothetical protein [Sediminihaliea albiluteola]MBA6413576.1 hypothetical protein [Sediminihaliea albiluteola]